MRELEGPAQREIFAMDYGRVSLAACAASVLATVTQGDTIPQGSNTAEVLNRNSDPSSLLGSMDDGISRNQSSVSSHAEKLSLLQGE